MEIQKKNSIVAIEEIVCMGKSVTRAAIVIMVMNLISKVLGFGRETVIAKQFGATSFTDAYLVAYTIPYFLQMVLGMALVSAIVPVVTKYIVQGSEKEAWRISSITLNWTVLFMTVFTIIGVIGARVLVYVTAYGFDEATAGLATEMTIIMFPSVIFMCAGMLITGILNAKKYFAVPAFVPGFTSLVIIISVLFLGKYGIHYLAWGTLVGMTGAMIIQIPVLKKVGFRYYWDWNLRHPEVKKIFAYILPIFLGTAVNQLYLAINRYFASALSEGSISSLNYASKLMNLPLGIFVLAVSSAIFPTLSEQAVQGDRDLLGTTMVRGLKMVLLITLPAAAGLIALRVPIVKLLFERGAFDALATQMTADALLYFCLGMFAMAVNMIITRAYYAVGDVKTPLIIGMLSIGVNIFVSIVLLRYMNHSGLALANTLASIFTAIFMYISLKRHLPRLYAKKLLTSGGKSIIASVLTGLSASVTFIFLEDKFLTVYAKDTKILLFKVAVSIFVGVIVYGLSVLILREEETIGFVHRVLKVRKC